MNIRELILPFILAMLTWWGIKYFFFGSTSADQYRFTAPQSAMECKPLNKGIQFMESKRVASPTITQVETAWGTLEFSTEGAALTRLAFKRKMNGDIQVLGTIFPPESTDMNNRAFLIALDGETPYNYHLVEQHEDSATISLAYQADAGNGHIKKTFTVHKDKHQMDLSIDLDPRGDRPMQARLFFPSPIMPALKDNAIAADVLDGNDRFSKVSIASLKNDDGWLTPEIFGAEDKYFVHAMVKDQESFAQRAYFNTSKEKITAIVEGPVVTSNSKWNLSFYLGPKEESAMVPVDSRLDQTLDHSGIWAPISRILLKILVWLYEYFHNYGIAIIVLTILIRLLLLPFSLSAERSMKDRAEMQKRLQYINQKHKDDPQAKMAAQAELMQKHGLGLGGCLPALLQLPIFFGLSRVLASSIMLYKAPFMWIPDLSAQDPYYILPGLVVAGMLFTAFTTPGDIKQKLPIIGMGVIFGAASTSFSAGLVLYIVVSVLLQSFQTKIFKLFRLIG